MPALNRDDLTILVGGRPKLFHKAVTIQDTTYNSTSQIREELNALRVRQHAPTAAAAVPVVLHNKQLVRRATRILESKAAIIIVRPSYERSREAVYTDSSKKFRPAAG